MSLIMLKVIRQPEFLPSSDNDMSLACLWDEIAAIFIYKKLLVLDLKNYG